MKFAIIFLTALLLFTSCGKNDTAQTEQIPADVPEQTQPAETEPVKPKTISITALGDSITRGYGLADVNAERFTSLVADEIEKAGMKVKIANYGVDGIKSDGLLDELEAGYYTAVKATEYVTLCVGANNILGAGFDFLESAASLEGDALKQSYNNFRKAADRGCKQLEKDLPVILETIREYNPTGKIILLNLYNPYGHIDVSMDSIEEGMTVASLTDEYIQKLNAITASFLPEVSALADIYTAFEGRASDLICAYMENGEMSNMDPHPNAAGHEVIAEVLWDTIEGLQ